MICDKCNRNVDNGYSIVHEDRSTENCCYSCAIREQNNQIEKLQSRLAVYEKALREIEEECLALKSVVDAVYATASNALGKEGK